MNEVSVLFAILLEMKKTINFQEIQWIQKPDRYIQRDDCLVIETQPHTMLRPYGRNGAEAVELSVNPKGNFHFTVRTDFEYRKAFDQCGILLYNDNVRKAVIGVEKRDGSISKLSSIVFHKDGNDRCERDIGSSIHWMYYRVWVRSDIARVQYSFNGQRYSDFRQFSFQNHNDIRIGFYACSPLDSYFDCRFSEMILSDEEEET